jgi:hypothetical protein
VASNVKVVVAPPAVKVTIWLALSWVYWVIVCTPPASRSCRVRLPAPS